MNPKVDTYLLEGCGRCDLHQTPQCKVNFYREPMELLRSILAKTLLKEEYKWSQPCYTLDGKNVLILTAYKDFCCLAFFKGSLMKDPENAMFTPGKNSQAARQLRFTTVGEINANQKLILHYINEAIELEQSGAKVDFKEKKALVFPPELIQIMNDDPAFRKAFEALTPGRQRGYNLFFSNAKQSITRATRIQRYKQQIFDGKGLND